MPLNINTNNLKKIDDLKKIEYTNDFKEFEWSNVLEKSNLYEFIMGIKN